MANLCCTFKCSRDLGFPDQNQRFTLEDLAPPTREFTPDCANDTAMICHEGAIEHIHHFKQSDRAAAPPLQDTV